MSGMDTGVSWRHQYLDSLSSGLEHLLNNEKFSDITITAGEHVFKCHRVILSCVSPYFEAMFSSGMKESVTGEVKIEGINSEVFKDILAYIYSGIDIVREDNAEEVLKGAAVLQMDCLQRRCEEFLSRRLSVSNCISCWRLAHWHSCMQLSQKAWSYVMEHFTELSKMEEFLALESDELISMLKDDNLCAADEEFIVETALRWVAFDQETRAQSLPAIFRSVRLSLTHPQFLVDIVGKHGAVVRDCPEVLDTIDRAKNFHLLPSIRHNFVSELMSPRRCSQWEDVLVVMSGGESPKPPYIRSKNVFAYSFNSQQWFYLAPLPHDPGIEFTSCVYDNDIFITGGGLLQTCFMRYRAKKNKWNNCRAKLKKGRRRHAMAACGNKIYVIGGFNAELEERARVQNSIEEYELDTGEWVEVAHLEQPVSSVSATAFGDRIFIFGGERNDSTDACVVQCFDTALRTVSVVSSLPLNSKLSRAVVCDNDTYLMLFDGKVIKYSPEEQTTKIVGEIKNFDRVHFGMVHRRGILYVLGGQKIGPSRALCDAMMTFDIHTNVARTIQDRVPTPRLLDSCAKITVDKKFLSKEVCMTESVTTPS
ncbi:kelch-like protein 24 [Babylonia areolata]|uniref:kelch-like protein 24 n=1 Tax=Babylonia areolata TaxID=304850 RepID=UPI003FD4DEAA